MSTPIDIAIYAAILCGYLSVLFLTERTAARYVAAEARPRPETRVFVVAGGRQTRSRVAVEPAYGKRVATPAR